MTFRIIGTERDVFAAIDRLGAVFQITRVSKLYKAGDGNIRVYVDVKPEPSRRARYKRRQ